MILLFSLLVLKHFIADFPLQIPYMYRNKGKWLHPGGLLHSLVHAVFTFWILWFCAPTYEWLFVGDFIIHYVVDWGKMRINSQFNLQPDNSEFFWWLLGFDQLLHYFTYIGIVWIIYG